MSLIYGTGDAHFEGEITVYATRAMAITGAEKSALTRFTIGVKVSYTNDLDSGAEFRADLFTVQGLSKFTSRSSLLRQT